MTPSPEFEGYVREMLARLDGKMDLLAHRTSAVEDDVKQAKAEVGLLRTWQTRITAVGAFLLAAIGYLPQLKEYFR